MTWACSIKEGRKRNSRLVCMGCCQEIMVLGGNNMWWATIKTAKEQKEQRGKIEEMVAEAPW